MTVIYRDADGHAYRRKDDGWWGAPQLESGQPDWAMESHVDDMDLEPEAREALVVLLERMHLPDVDAVHLGAEVYP